MTPCGASEFETIASHSSLDGRWSLSCSNEGRHNLVGNFVRRFSNAFHMGIDNRLARYFCLPAVTAMDLGMTGRKLENRTLQPDTLIFFRSDHSPWFALGVRTSVRIWLTLSLLALLCTTSTLRFSAPFAGTTVTTSEWLPMETRHEPISEVSC